MESIRSTGFSGGQGALRACHSRLPCLLPAPTWAGELVHTPRHRQSGRNEARTGLRMMPTSPRSPLSFRTAGFPQYGWKAGMSDGAFPMQQRLKPAPGIRQLRHGLHSSFAHLVVRIGCPVLCRAEDSLVCRHWSRVLLRPRGPRSGPGYSVPTHQRLSAPSDPLAGTSRFRRLCDLYAMPSLCGCA